MKFYILINLIFAIYFYHTFDTFGEVAGFTLLVMFATGTIWESWIANGTNEVERVIEVVVISIIMGIICWVISMAL